MATDEYQLRWRTANSTIVIKDNLYCWEGFQEDVPKVHDNEDTRKISSVDVFHLQTFKWERKSTTGIPPSGCLSYACTNIKENIYYFGGKCKPLHSYLDDLYELNTITDNWRQFTSSTPDNSPMKKRGCGMISFNIDGEDNLLLVGGFGPTPVTKHTHSQYVPHPDYPNDSITNEVHIMCISLLPGEWKIPVITGTRPPACSDFTINTLPGNRGVIFGGYTIDETGENLVDDLFMFTCSLNAIDFQKVIKSIDTGVNWPKRRNLHAGTVVNTISNKVVTSHLVILGGLDEFGNTLNDCWIINLSTFIWYQICLPDSVTERNSHSMTTYPISNQYFWIVVTGGDRGMSTFSHITGSDVTVIIELAYINNEWTVKHVWNNKQLMENKKEIQTNLIHHIVEDRLQEGTFMTDLISLIKSPSTIPHQVETQRLMEKKIFEKESKLLKLSLEIREKGDEIAHLKTRAVSLIKKSDTLEKELEILKDEMQTYKQMVITARQELQESQTLLMIEKKTSLVKSQELEFSRKQITGLKGKHKHTTTVSSDKEDMEAIEEKKCHQKTQARDDSKLQEDIESYQKIMISKNEQVKELQSMLEMERDEMKQLKLQVEEFKKTQKLRDSSSHGSEVVKYQRDAAVQFDYMVPVSDHLDGVHVAGETLFLIQGDKPQSLNWEEYGFKLHFPQGAISPSDTCEVVVKALVGGKFQFPKGTELVSAVYAVSCAKKLLKPVEMEIQHCVILTNEEQGKGLSFVSTPENCQDQPCNFEFVEGGMFYPGKRYASIQQNIYNCENGIVEYTYDQDESSGEEDTVKAKLQVETDKRHYTGQIYYIRKGYNRWQMKFIVVRDIDAFMKYVSTIDAEEDEVIRFTFQDPVNGYIELVLADMDQVTSQGWNIEPHKEPLRLRKRDIDLYGSQDLILPPSCLLSVWTESSLNPKTRLSHPVTLSGIDSATTKIYVRRFRDPVVTSSTSATTSHGPILQNKDNRNGPDFATPNIQCSVNKSYCDLLKKSPEKVVVLPLIKQLSASWNDFGRVLKVDSNYREKLMRDPMLTDDGRLEKVLDKWFGSKPSHVTWEMILDVLGKFGREDIAREVRTYLEEESYDK